MDSKDRVIVSSQNHYFEGRVSTEVQWQEGYYGHNLWPNSPNIRAGDFVNYLDINASASVSGRSFPVAQALARGSNFFTGTNPVFRFLSGCSFTAGRENKLRKLLAEIVLPKIVSFDDVGRDLEIGLVRSLGTDYVISLKLNSIGEVPSYYRALVDSRQYTTVAATESIGCSSAYVTDTEQGWSPIIGKDKEFILSFTPRPKR